MDGTKTLLGFFCILSTVALGITALAAIGTLASVRPACLAAEYLLYCALVAFILYCLIRAIVVAAQKTFWNRLDEKTCFKKLATFDWD